MRNLHDDLLLCLFFLLSSWSISLISSSLPLPSVQHLCLDDQRSILAQLQHDLLNYSSRSASFPICSSLKVQFWDLKTNCCSWEGVTCDTSGHVIGLDLSNSMLSGRFSSIFRLRHLQQLNLAGNNFELTPISSGFGMLENLTHLNLSKSCFSDQIPLEISHLTRLVSLDLSTNPGCLPRYNLNNMDMQDLEPIKQFFKHVTSYEKDHRLKLQNPNLKMFVQNLSSLTELKLDHVDISAQGTSWCEALSHALPNLRLLSLSHCRLSGSIHPSLSKLHFLSELRLDGNRLSSVAPNFLGNFSHLVTLSLSSCELRGNLPGNVFQLPKLQSIEISKNSFLTGQLPEFPLNNALQVLSLHETSFGGKLPDSIGNLKFLTNLRLQNCNLSGSLPSSLANLTQLVKLNLGGNKFSGSIPHFHSDGVPNLAYLDLGYNQLEGVVYSSLFTLPSLQTLKLSGNRLFGQLDEFPNASSSLLEFLYLSGNNLSGPIPRSVFELPRLVDLSLADNNFHGTIKLDMLQNLKNLKSLDLSDNSLSIESGNSNITLPQFERVRLRSCNITEFPEFLRSQDHLYSLILSSNQIHGYVPSWIWKKTLRHLDLSYNAIDILDQPHLGVSGHSMPIFNGDENYSPYFGILKLRSCNISRFPIMLKNLDHLWHIDLSDNKIHGQIPNWIWKKNLHYLNLSYNSLDAFEKFLPNVSFTSLHTLDLHANMLQCSLPKEICNLSELFLLDASQHHLSGTISECLDSKIKCCLSNVACHGSMTSKLLSGEEAEVL